MVGSRLRRLFKDRRVKDRPKRGSRETATEMSTALIKKAERSLGYTFENKSLLVKSLTHPSYLLHTKEQINNNQRLEFLGDSVIQLVLTEALYAKFPNEREGRLTSLRSGYARGDYMAGIARRLKLNEYLLLRPKDRDAGIGDQDSALGDAFESVIGAVYLDSDWRTARELVMRLYGDLKNAPTDGGSIANPKGALQELVQPDFGNHALRYTTVRQTGQPHNREFEVEVFCNDELLGKGKGRSKKEAEEKAAIEALATFGGKKR